MDRLESVLSITVIGLHRASSLAYIGIGLGFIGISRTMRKKELGLIDPVLFLSVGYMSNDRLRSDDRFHFPKDYCW